MADGGKMTTVASKRLRSLLTSLRIREAKLNFRGRYCCRDPRGLSAKSRVDVVVLDWGHTSVAHTVDELFQNSRSSSAARLTMSVSATGGRINILTTMTTQTTQTSSQNPATPTRQPRGRIIEI